MDSSSGSTFIYFSTGDGDFDLYNAGGTNASDSFVKVTTSLTIPGGAYTSSNFFTPSDQCWRQGTDHDYGSGGVMLVPDNLISSNPYLAIKADKENYLWVINRGAPGGYDDSSCPNQPTRGLQCQTTNVTCDSSYWTNHVVQELQINNGGDSHTTPAFWAGNTSGSQKGWVFFAASGDYLRGYAVDPTNCGVLCASTHSMTTPMNLGYSATPAVSSAPTYTNGIVWAIKNVTTALGLYAFDATNLQTELYDSNKCIIGAVPVDRPGNPTRFSVPTIANGHVYIGTETDFDIYGQLPQTRNCIVPQ